MSDDTNHTTNHNIIPLRADPTTATPPAPRIFICSCGCSTYELWEDNTLHCALCHAEHTMADGGGWYKNEMPSLIYEGEEPTRTVQGNGDTEFARRLIARRAQAEDAKAIVVLRENGAIHAWSAAETPEQSLWAMRHLKAAMKMLRWPK